MEDFSTGDHALVREHMMDADGGDASQEAVIVFSTDLPDLFHLPKDPLVVPAHFQRLDLSKLVNQLLQQKVEAEDGVDRWHHQPFDFVVDGEIFLRTSLHEYMMSHGLTAEVPLCLKYQLAVRRLREQHLPSSRDWIASLASLPRQGLLVEASYDGCCRVHHLPSLLCTSSSTASPDRQPKSVTCLPLSSTLVGVRLNQGPLGAAAAFAGGAYMPSSCLQVFLGSKGGGYNVVHMWEMQQEQCENEERSSREHSVIWKDSVAAGADDHCHGGNVAGVASKSGSRDHEQWINKEKTISGAAVKTVGCQGSEITCLDVSHDGVTVASGGADGTVLLWDNVPDMRAAATQHQEREDSEYPDGRGDVDYPGPTHGSVCSKAFDALATGFISGVRGKRKRVAQKPSSPSSSWCIRAKEPKLVLESHCDRVTDLCFPSQPLRCVLYTGALDETICGWDTLVGATPLSIWTTSRPVTSVCCSPADGTVVCSAHVDGRLRLWDIRSGTVEASIKDTDGDAGQHTCGRQGASRSSNGAILSEAGLSTVHDVYEGSGKRFSGTAHMTLSANSRLDRRFTFGSVPDRRATTRARWCPVKEGEYWIATVSQDGMLRLRDIRAPSMPLFSVEVRGRHPNDHVGDEGQSSAAEEMARRRGTDTTSEKGLPVRLLTCSWLDGHRIVTGGSDGIIRIFTVGATGLIEQA